jgi:hypothetical protein
MVRDGLRPPHHEVTPYPEEPPAAASRRMRFRQNRSDAKVLEQKSALQYEPRKSLSGLAFTKFWVQYRAAGHADGPCHKNFEGCAKCLQRDVRCRRAARRGRLRLALGLKSSICSSRHRRPDRQPSLHSFLSGPDRSGQGVEIYRRP